ncbi:OmpA family protein [Vibrio chagasii]|uniref:OmpA family protein n=1 Tax=Vibrio chagasii TaxID=170679 RepID=UPI003DA0F1D9
MIKQLLIIASAISPLLSHASLYSDNYAGVKVGYTDFLSQECDASNFNCDKDDLAFGLYAGHYVNDWLAIELAYNKLGSTYVSAAKNRASLTATEVNQLDISPRFDFTLNDKWLFFTKIGVSYLDINTQGFNFNEGDSNWAPSFAIGSEYQLTNDWKLRFDASTTTQQHTQSFNKVDPLFFGVGFTYRPKIDEPTVITAKEPITVKPSPKETVIVPFKKRIYFEHASSEVADGSVISQLYNDLKTKRVKAITLVGRTDDTGTEEYNIGFGLVRANTIRTYLIEQGIDESAIEIKSIGESNPVASNQTQEGRALNRFVEIQEQIVK